MQNEFQAIYLVVQNKLLNRVDKNSNSSFISCTWFDIGHVLNYLRLISLI